MICWPECRTNLILNILPHRQKAFQLENKTLLIILVTREIENPWRVHFIQFYNKERKSFVFLPLIGLPSPPAVSFLSIFFASHLFLNYRNAGCHSRHLNCRKRDATVPTLTGQFDLSIIPVRLSPKEVEEIVLRTSGSAIPFESMFLTVNRSATIPTPLVFFF